MAVRFPLPPEHRFGRVRVSPMIHDGSGTVQETMALRLWQARVKFRFPDEHLRPTGLVDAATIRIAISLQTAAGIPATGMIDEETWDLAWS